MARRNKGEGSIYRLEGRRGFRAQVTLKGGKRLTRQFPTSKAASAWIREITLRDERRGPADLADLTLEEWMERFLEERATTKRPSTVAIDLNHWRNHFGPIRSIRLIDLDYLVIRHWLDMLSRGFVTTVRPNGQPHTVRLCYSLLRSALQSAVERDVLESNPMVKVKRPVVPRAAPKFLRADELKVVLDHLAATHDERELAVQLMVRLGLRRGEALGLTWGDVDLDTGRIAITLQLQRVPDEDEPCTIVASPRAAQDCGLSSRRSGHRDAPRAAAAHRRGQRPRADELLVTLRGRPVDPQNLTQWLSARSREVGVRCSPHRLRHTAATLMLNEVGSISTVSSFLGHTETRTTSIYARVLDETSEAATEALGSAVDRLS